MPAKVFFFQGQNSYFRVTHYKANQTNGYANLQYEFSYKNNSILKTGISFRHLNLLENISFSNNSLNRTYAGRYNKVENIPGIFAENTLSLISADPDKLVWIAGIRADHHNKFGWEITPRTLLKYELTKNTSIRGSIGTGWRTANIFSENIGLLASSRDIIFAGLLKPEKALNLGINATQKFRRENLEGYVSLDFYRTDFTNQIFPDYDTDPTKAIITNFTGKSVSNAFQAEVSGTFYNRFSAKIGYVFLDVYQMKNGEKDVLPFNPRNRLHSSASFYTIKKFEVYVGAENIFNFRQNKPIISWQNPFGKYFDTQFAWGPTRGRETYLGIRFTIK